MSGKESQSKFDKTNFFVETYHKEYLGAPTLELGALDLEKLENMLFGIAHAHDLIGRQVQDLSSVVGVLSAENAQLQKKLSQMQRRSSRLNPPNNIENDENQPSLSKRDRSSLVELGGKENSAVPSKFIIVSKRGKGANNLTLQEVPKEKSGGTKMDEEVPRAQQNRLRMQNPHLQEDNCSINMDRACKDKIISSTLSRTEISSGIRTSECGHKNEESGFVIPLLEGGLKRTFVRNNKCLVTVMEEKEGANSQLSVSRTPQRLGSPRRNINIEELRMGFSAEGKDLIRRGQDKISHDSSESMNKLDRFNWKLGSQGLAGNLGFTVTSRVTLFDSDSRRRSRLSNLIRCSLNATPELTCFEF